MKLTSQKQVRAAFWYNHFVRKPAKWRGKSQNELPADVRAAFVEYVDDLAREGEISERLAQRVTL